MSIVSKNDNFLLFSLESWLETYSLYFLYHVILNESVFNYFNRSFKGVEKCLAPLKPTCSPAAKTQYEGVETASTFMCIEGKEGI